MIGPSGNVTPSSETYTEFNFDHWCYIFTKKCCYPANENSWGFSFCVVVSFPDYVRKRIPVKEFDIGKHLCRFMFVKSNNFQRYFLFPAYKGSRNQWTSMTPICVSSNRGWPRSSKGPKGLEDLERSLMLLKRFRPGDSKAKPLVGVALSTEVHMELLIHLVSAMTRKRSRH